MIVFRSNYLNHHQLPFCEAMLRLTGGDFRFVATERMSSERARLGWQDMNGKAFVLKDGSEETDKLLLDADLVINAGPVYESSTLVKRVRQKKITMIYSERPFKARWTPHLFLRRTASMLIKYVPYDKPNVYFLAASAYASRDFSKYGLFKHKAFKWGYFPALRTYDDFDALYARKTPRLILWCARFIDFKRPFFALHIAQKLKENGTPFTLRMIGDGPLKPRVEEETKKLGLSAVIEFAGALGFEAVRDEMEKASAFLFTSDRGEGWGAVINEAMNSGCAVIASRAAGSVLFLIKHGENGFSFDGDDLNSASALVSKALQDDAQRRALSLAAYRTICAEWNAEAAAKRLLVLFDAIRHGEDLRIYGDGPCSPDFQ